MKMLENILTDEQWEAANQYAYKIGIWESPPLTYYQDGVLWGATNAEKELADLRAENERLRNVLTGATEELERIWKEFEIGDEMPRLLGRLAIEKTTTAETYKRPTADFTLPDRP